MIPAASTEIPFAAFAKTPDVFDTIPLFATTAIVASYYWHFVDVVWIVIFTLVYLIPS